MAAGRDITIINGVPYDKHEEKINELKQKMAKMEIEIDKLKETPGANHKVIAETRLAAEALSLGRLDDAKIHFKRAKIDAEKSLLVQKTVSELAQTEDDATGTGGSLNEGLIGKQKLLYVAQTDGFARDAEQKFAKIASDMWAVAYTVEGTTFGYPAGWSGADINNILNKVATGIGVSTE
jgi:hypothetical protein